MPSNPKGFVTTPIVKAPDSLAISAITGAAPVPVPPPIPAATNTKSESSTNSLTRLLLSSAHSLPFDGSPPTPSPLAVFSPIFIAVGAPSSMAVEMSMEHGMTLIGFVKNEVASVYSCPSRVIID